MSSVEDEVARLRDLDLKGLRKPDRIALQQQK
jgi:hypothetical protein